MFHRLNLLCRQVLRSRAWVLGGLSLMAVGSGQFMGRECLAQPSYSITAVGLFDAAHTSTSGARFSELYGFSNRDQLVGRSQRYNGDAAHGWSTWFYAGNDVRVMGLVDSEHTRSDGYRVSEARGIVRPGYVYGDSERYFGNVRTGSSTWVFAGVNTTRVGLFDANHTSASGFRNSLSVNHDNYGFLYGSSNNFYSAQSGKSAWKFINGVSENIGLVDADHIRSDGFRSSRILRVGKGTGAVVGEAMRFAGANDGGRSIWVHDGSGTRNIGLTDAEHTSASNRREAEFRDTSGNGFLGVSDRYAGDADLGQSAWWHANGTTQKIGLTDAAHTRGDGYQWNNVLGFTNNAGTLAYGVATQFLSGTTDQGQHVWLSDGQATTVLSPTDAEHTRSDGFQSSSVNKIGKTIYGHSQRFNEGSSSLGQSVWVWENNAVNLAGLKNSTHTRANGFQRSEVQFVTNSGFVVGSSDRFNNTTANRGVSAWIYRNGVTTNISALGAEFTALNGTRRSTALQVTEQGQVVGTAKRYLGTNLDKGQAVWYYNGATTEVIGLRDAAHTDVDGTQNNAIGDRHGSFKAISRNGMVRGTAERFAGKGGQSTWLYNGTETRQIGLIDSRHTRLDDYRFSEFTSSNSLVNPFNDNGQVIGYSQRYGGAKQLLGQTAWMYDPTLNTTVGFELSQTSNGFANSVISYFDNDGLVLGWYDAFGANDESLGRRAFLYSLTDGLNSLGDLIAGGLSNSGWQSLAQTVQAYGYEKIVGYGLMEDMTSGQVVFVLNQQMNRFAIPEPTVMPWLIGALAGLSLYRRKSTVVNG